jgi:alkylation response protein AidB-like acyl-CoA dehydrogenase
MNNILEQKLLVEEAKIFAEKEIKPNSAKFDETGILPKKLIKQLSERKYLSASFPKDYGGLELDPITYGLFTEEIGKACCSVRSLITVHTSLVGETLLRWGTKEQKDKWLPKMALGEKIGAFALTEPDVGSDAKGVKTSYRKESDRFVINGKKKWISFGCLADFFIVFASFNTTISAFIVERDAKGMNIGRIPGLLANRAAYVAEIEMKDVSVPKENLLCREGSGFPYIIGTALDNGRYSVAWGAVAIAQASLEAMIKYARQRNQFGKKIYEFQLVRGLIGNAVSKTHAARALCMRAGEKRKKGDIDASAETNIAKYFSSKIALEVAADAVQVHGGNGCSNNYPVERLFREAKILEIIEGTSQIQQEMIANYGLRKYFFKDK